VTEKGDRENRISTLQPIGGTGESIKGDRQAMLSCVKKNTAKKTIENLTLPCPNGRGGGKERKYLLGVCKKKGRKGSSSEAGGKGKGKLR